MALAASVAFVVVSTAVAGGKGLTQAKRDTERPLTKAEWAAFGERLNGPMIELAERVERFEGAFEGLRSDYAGFAPAARFLFEKRDAGDVDAARALGVVTQFVRSVRLGQPFPNDLEAEERFLEAHRAEYDAFKDAHYPWLKAPSTRQSSVIVLGSKETSPNPKTDAVFDAEVTSLGQTAGMKMRRIGSHGESARRWAFDLEGRQVVIRLSKSSGGLSATPYLELPQFGVGHSLGDVFAFSDGWPEFHTSAADDPESEMRDFFASYRRVFPFVVNALRSGISAANEYLRSIGKEPLAGRKLRVD